MSGTLASAGSQAADLRQRGADDPVVPPLPAAYITRLAGVLRRCGLGPEFCDAQRQGRDVWGPVGVLLRRSR